MTCKFLHQINKIKFILLNKKLKNAMTTTLLIFFLEGFNNFFTANLLTFT